MWSIRQLLTIILQLAPQMQALLDSAPDFAALERGVYRITQAAARE